MFGTIAWTHFTAISAALGTLVGSAVGGLLGARSACQRIGFGLALAAMAGAALGTAGTLFRMVRIHESNEAVYEHLVSETEAAAALRALNALEAGTNRLHRFQWQNRAILSNYLQRADQASTGTYSGIVTADLFTNSGTYRAVKKYLAGHWRHSTGIISMQIST